jgi:hypothetical protein
MASKARGGLSKGELKRAQAAKAKPVIKKVSPQRSVSKPAPLYGAGPLMPGQKRVANSYGGDKNVPDLVGAGPLLPGQKRVQPKQEAPKLVNKSITKNTNKKSNRSLASKALGLLTGASTAQAADSAPTVNTTPQRNLVPTQVKSGLGRSLGYAKDIASDVIGILPGIGLPAQQLIKRAPDLGATETLGLNKYLQKDSGMAFDTESQPYIDAFNAEGNRQDFSPTVENLNQTRRNTNIVKNYQSGNQAPFESAPFQGPKRTEAPGNNYEQDYEKTLQDEMSPVKDYLNLSSSPVAPAGPVNPADAPLADTPGGTVAPRSGRGSGLFATGKGVENPAGPEDEYLSMLRKSMKGYGNQEEDVMRQFKNLIKALDPTYDEYQKEGQKTLEQELQRNLTQLAAVMNSNNTGDSEQRAQMMAGLQRDNQNSLGDLIRKLMLQKNEDINKYKSQSVEAVNSVRDKQMSARERYAQALKDYKQQQFENQYKMSSLGSRGGGSTKAGSITYMGDDPRTGEPVYYNSTTGARVVGAGLKRGSNPLEQAMAAMLGQNGGQQGGGWETDPITGEQVWVTD